MPKREYTKHGRSSIRRKILTALIGVTIFLMFANAAITIYLMNAVTIYTRSELNTVLYEDYDAMIKSQVETASTLLHSIHTQVEADIISKEQGKQMAENVLRDLRYGEEGYFWADTSDGTNVVLLGREDVEGTNRDSLQDAYGTMIIQELRNQAMAGGGYTNYYFPKKGTTEPLQKRGYSMYIQPYDWIIGTGNYTDDIHLTIGSIQNRFQEQLQQINMLITAINLLTLLGIIWIAFSIGNKISSPIIKLSELVNRTAAFNLLYDPAFEGLEKNNDETGIIATAIFDMRLALREMMSKNKQFTSTLVKNTAIINQNSQQNQISIEQVAKAIEELANGATEEVFQIENGRETLDLLSKKVDEMVVNSTQMYDYTTETEKANQTGFAAMEIISAKFKANSDITEKMSESILSLADQSSSISNIITVIQNIAEQTNLLALNAAIEAARAGESGKGFAVVADEIRKLSEQTAHSTKEIEQLTSQVHQEVHKAKQNMDAAKIVVKDSDQASKDALKVFMRINDATKNTVLKVSEMLQNIKQVEKNKEEAQKSFYEITAIAQGFSSLAEEISASVQEQTASTEQNVQMVDKMNQMSVELEKIVSVFKL